MLSTLLLALGCPAHGGRGPADGSNDGGVPDATPDGSRPDGSGPDGGTQGPPGCNPPTSPAPEVTMCPGGGGTQSGEDTCSVSPGDDNLLITGQVLTPGEVLEGGQVLVDSDGLIQCVGCDCSGEAAATSATAIECPNGVISPGLINTHDHLTFDRSPPYSGTAERYEHRHEWREGLGEHEEIPSRAPGISRDEAIHIAWSELRQVLSGTTSINGSGGEDGLLRNLDRSSMMEGLGQPDVRYETFPLDDTSGTLLRDSCDYGSGRDRAELASSVEAYTPHIAEGIAATARNEFLCSREGDDDLIQDPTAVIHGVGVLPPDIGEMAADGSALIWSPRSNISLYGDTARVTQYDRMGVPIALGTDWIRSGSMNMLRELSCAAQYNAEYLDGYFSDEELWLMATREAAAVLAMDDALGTLEPGKVADISIFDGSEREHHRAVLDASAKDVALVVRGGDVLYGDGSVVQSVPESGDCATMDVCGRAKRACVERETGMGFDALADANSDSYGLFFCGEVEEEPTCTPTRNADSPFPDPQVNGSSRYTGEITDSDGDGDGIADGEDNCPCTFNPVRPLDNGSQGDFDDDGVGNACDPCPLDPNTTECSAGTGGDRDGDGEPDEEDNCPGMRNPDQMDADGDGKGDVCDPCPEDANPGVVACPATIYEIKDGTVEPDSTVSVQGPVVTAVGPIGFFIQVPSGADHYSGADHSGIYVYTGGEPSVSRGDRVDVTSARVNDFFGQIQLSSPMVSVTESGVNVPSPAQVSATEIETDGSRADALEGALVQVSGVAVTNASPEPGPGDDTGEGEFEVEGGLRVDDFMHRIDPAPAEGETFESLTGPLAFRNNYSKLLPRDADDVVPGPRTARLTEITPSGLIAAPGDSISFTVELSQAAPSGGALIDLSVDQGGSLPDNVTIPEGMQQAEFTFDANDTLGEATVTASYEGGELTAKVLVTDGNLLINEIDYDQDGSDDAEFVEILNTSSVSWPLDDVALVLVNGNGSEEYARAQLSGSLAAGGYLVVVNGNVTVPSSASRVDISDNLQNGSPDGVALVDTSSGILLDALSYEGEITAAQIDGFTEPFNLVSGTATTAEDTNDTERSLVRMPNGSDTGDDATDWAEASTPTPGEAN
jgi:imidazolonepropionase-like amidohydrolase